MDLKRQINYQWQLFIPLVATIWLIIGILAYWQYYNERQYRKEQIDGQLDLVTKRIVASYETDFDPTKFVDFVCGYYRDNPLYDLLRVSVYVDGELSRAWGEPIGLSEKEVALSEGLTRTPEINRTPEDAEDSDSYFYYKVLKSNDERIVVCSVLPFDNDILSATLPSYSMFWFVIVLGVVATVSAYISTRYFGRNIKLLRTIAERAATDPTFIPAPDFPHDELGDISRQIVSLYNEKTKALDRQRREHAVALHAIEEKARSKRQLTNNINHELRTPIGVIKGYLDTIIENPDMDEASRTHFISKAQEHVQRLVNLIADVSAITRLEEGGDLISTEELNFHDVAFTIASDFEESHALGDMTFSFDIPLNCKINGNYNLLSGMIINLAKNSAAYSRGTECELLLTGEDKDFYHFEFRDNGIGVGEEHLPHLFERFYRIDSGRSRKAGGSGLGLPIVQNTVKAHGGTITACIGERGGLAFKFTLPKYKEGNR